MYQSITKRSFTAFLAFFVAGVSLLTALPIYAQGDEEEYTEEPTSDIHVRGQIIELSSTDLPTTIVVRENPEGEFTDYTVDISESTIFNISMENWMVGDYADVWGELNENTAVVSADRVNNVSMNPFNHHGLNGWIDWIADDGSQIGVQWDGVIHTVNITENTHLVGDSGPHGDISDFEVEDRIRLRLTDDSAVENEARIVMILRRGPYIFNLARTRGFDAELLEIDEVNQTLNVQLYQNPHLADGDVNNLVGIEGDVVTVSYDENTRFRRKFFGDTDVSEFIPGDRLQIVGRVDDDGTILARMIRDENVFRFGVAYHVGEILEVNTDENYVVIERKRGHGNDEWTINYDDNTTFFFDREEDADESVLEVGLDIRVRGTANNQLNTVEAVSIAVFEEEKPLEHKPARLKDILDEVKDFEHHHGHHDEDEDSEEVEDEFEDEHDEDEMDDQDEDDESDDEDGDSEDSTDDSSDQV